MTLSIKTPQAAVAQRAGRALGRTWAKLARLENSARDWLVSQGLPQGIAGALLLIAKLAVLGIVLYRAFWAALVLAFAIVSTWLAGDTDAEEEKQPKLRDGHSEIGLYDKDDWRIDLGDPEYPLL
ncbi:MAG: DUF3742 family protein [Candidatus Accumulibacter sp.]|nr:DUF3742 family protein [Accumulibacter sp.]